MLIGYVPEYLGQVWVWLVAGLHMTSAGNRQLYVTFSNECKQNA